MKGIMCDPKDFVPINDKMVLVAQTDKGIITIEDTGTIIVATGNSGIDRIAETRNRNEAGLRWIKNQCRGYYTWQRLKWKTQTKL